MIDQVETIKPDNKFLSTLTSDYRSVTNMPKDLSVKDDIKYGLLALKKWSEESGGNETAGVMWVNPLGDISFKELAKGSEDMVPIHILDLTKYSPEEAERYLNQFKLREKTFVLLPEHTVETVTLPGDHIVERGKKVLGSVHVHPSGNPPSAGDFTLALFFQEQAVKGVIAGDELYLFVRTKETPQLDITVNQDNSNNMMDYQRAMEQEIEDLEKKGLTTPDARNQILIKHVHQNNITLYKGTIAENNFQKII
ncbi:hypothetical protein HY029_05880 [Candidatus Gottesmanbacteria bacterium]|nr:hypothetical protein [Candidatus Gottesmanbacteria bacterium]